MSPIKLTNSTRDLSAVAFDGVGIMLKISLSFLAPPSITLDIYSHHSECKKHKNAEKARDAFDKKNEKVAKRLPGGAE